MCRNISNSVSIHLTTVHKLCYQQSHRIQHTHQPVLLVICCIFVASTPSTFHYVCQILRVFKMAAFFFFDDFIRRVAMTFTEWFYCKHTCTLRGFTLAVLPLSSCALAQRCCHYWILFIYIGYLQYPEIFVTIRQTLFLERATSHSDIWSQIRETGWDFDFSNRI